MAAAAEITTLHRSLSQEITRIIAQRVSIERARPGTDWAKVALESEVSFELRARDRVRGDTARRQRGGRVSVVALHKVDPQAGTRESVWVSWFERWKKVGQNSFDFVTGAWTVFYGPPYSEEKTQVLRAEWDAITHLQGVLREAAQPHWHFDTSLGGQAVRSSGAQVPDAVALEELPPDSEYSAGDEPNSWQEDIALRLGAVHLGMGAWDNADTLPACWQRQWSGKAKELSDWVIRTLRYLRSQLEPGRGYLRWAGPAGN